MRLSKAKEVIKEIYKTNSVTALISERGVGKTSIYKQATKELGIGYIDIYAAALEGPDFMGLPQKNLENGTTTYLAPSFLPTVESVKQNLHPEKGIFVIEEINRVPPDTISILYPLLLEREFNGHRLADGWRIGVTFNPDNLNYMVNSLDDAIIDRFISLWIEPHIEDYISYSLSTTYNTQVIDYLKAYPQMLLVTKKSSTPLLKSPTPRGWSKVQELLNICSFNNDDDLLQETISGIVGPEAAASFRGFSRSNRDRLPNADDLLTDYAKVQPLVYSLINNNNFDTLTILINSIISHLDPVNGSQIAQLDQFLTDIPQDLQVLFFKELSTQREDLLDVLSEKLTVFDAVSDVIVGFYDHT